MVKYVMIEGELDEVLALVTGLEASKQAGPAVAAAAPVDPDAEVDSDEKVFATMEVARKVFGRRPLSKEQKAVIQLLAANDPDWVTAAELQAATGYSRQQFAGLMGAFGRRATHTPGWVEGSTLFDYQWNEDTGAWDYRLPPTVLEAAKHEKIV